MVDKTEPFRLENHSVQVRNLETEFHLTDCGNAERFANQHSKTFRFCSDLRQWLYFDTQRWNTLEGQDKARQTAIKIAREMLVEASKIEEKSERKKLADWAFHSESSHHIAAMLSLAQSLPGIVCYSREFDRNPDIVTCLNGTIDLRTGELLPHRPEDLITKLLPVIYDPNAKFDL